ncbi:hypothetical protein G9A89_008924 [Geosiphon pyriformis]|nr:hypothetical protein G9A89_008924 [Geosiphon pyriformis]
MSLDTDRNVRLMEYLQKGLDSVTYRTSFRNGPNLTLWTNQAASGIFRLQYGTHKVPNRITSSMKPFVGMMTDDCVDKFS